MRDLIMTILTAGVQLVIMVALGYFINFLYAKIGTEKTKKYFDIAKMLVRGVEQEFGSGNGADKKVEVFNLLKKITGNMLSEEEIDKLIEAAVFEMNYILNLKGIQSMSKKV